MYKHGVNKFPLVIKYVPDQYKTQTMCDKVIPENGGMLMFIRDCYKGPKICNKDVDNCAHVLGSVPHCYKTPKKMCNTAVSTYLSAIQFVPD